MAALTVGTIDSIARRIRTSNSNEWRHYWNKGPHGFRSEPKVERVCRDSFLTALRPLLPESVRAEPEGQHVNQTRSDVAISAGRFMVPVEAKKNGSPDLWSAIDNQLVAKYTLDPATGGYGVHLVFWFGAEHQRKRAEGAKPTTPQELGRLLRNSLSEDQARRVQIRVVDVGRPGPFRESRLGIPDSGAVFVRARRDEIILRRQHCTNQPHTQITSGTASFAPQGVGRPETGFVVCFGSRICWAPTWGIIADPKLQI